jgi:hypothetical protein
MNFNSYTQGKMMCLSEGRSIDCAYIFYTTDDSPVLLPSLTAANIDLVCSEKCGVLRSKGVICKNIENSTLNITLTSQGGKRLGINTPEFTAGVKVYNIALAVSGDNPEDDILMVSTELTQPYTIPAGTHIVTDIKIELR